MSRTNAAERAALDAARREQDLLLGDVTIACNQRHQAIADGLRANFQETKEEIRNKVCCGSPYVR